VAFNLVPETPLALAAFALILAGIALAAWRRFPWAYTFIVISFGVFVIQMVAPSMGAFCGFVVGGRPAFGNTCVNLELGFVEHQFLSGEQWWSPLTSMFLHGGVLHIFGNVIILALIGPRLEDRIGGTRFALAYLGAGIVGALATIPVVQAGIPDPQTSAFLSFIPTLGASGAIFGVLAVLIVLYPKDPIPTPIPLGPMGVGFLVNLPAYMAGVVYLGMNIVYYVTGASVAWWGHLGGFIAGVPIALYLRPRLHRIRERTGPVSVNALSLLATTDAQRAALAEIEKLNVRQTRDDETYQRAWLDRFAAGATCPQCGRVGLYVDGDELKSSCGWTLPFR
jgi:membrane associated rhomboid family serine protease